MEKKTTIDSIKKCLQNSNILSLEETDKAIGVKSNFCSSFLKSNDLMIQGEYFNQKSDERNAVVTFRDPATGKIIGLGSGFCTFFVSVFLILILSVIP